MSTSIPCRRSAIARVRPPTPAPTTAMRRLSAERMSERIVGTTDSRRQLKVGLRPVIGSGDDEIALDLGAALATIAHVARRISMLRIPVQGPEGQRLIGCRSPVDSAMCGYHQLSREPARVFSEQ